MEQRGVFANVRFCALVLKRESCGSVGGRKEDEVGGGAEAGCQAVCYVRGPE
jgi:hypothetical protein